MRKPVFIRHRTPEEIAIAKKDDQADLPDPEASQTEFKEKWLLMVGVCTHFGCIPLETRLGSKGEFGGWFCLVTDRITILPDAFVRGLLQRT